MLTRLTYEAAKSGEEMRKSAVLRFIATGIL
jgi:hypothetical protein